MLTGWNQLINYDIINSQSDKINLLWNTYFIDSFTCKSIKPNIINMLWSINFNIFIVFIWSKIYRASFLLLLLLFKYQVLLLKKMKFALKDKQKIKYFNSLCLTSTKLNCNFIYLTCLFFNLNLYLFINILQFKIHF